MINVGDIVQHILMSEHRGVVLSIYDQQAWVMDEFFGYPCTFELAVLTLA